MKKRLDIQTTPDGAFIRIGPNRDLTSTILWALILAFVSTHIGSMGWSGAVIWVMLAYMAWRFLWNLFGVEEITLTSEALTFTNRLFFLHRTKRSNGQDINWIAYHPVAYRARSGIGVLLKDRGTTFDFGKDLSLEEATKVIDVMKANAPWLGSRLKGTSELSYYKLG